MTDNPVFFFSFFFFFFFCFSAMIIEEKEGVLLISRGHLVGPPDFTSRCPRQEAGHHNCVVQTV